MRRFIAKRPLLLVAFFVIAWYAFAIRMSSGPMVVDWEEMQKEALERYFAGKVFLTDKGLGTLKDISNINHFNIVLAEPETKLLVKLGIIRPLDIRSKKNESHPDSNYKSVTDYIH